MSQDTSFDELKGAPSPSPSPPARGRGKYKFPSPLRGEARREPDLSDRGRVRAKPAEGILDSHEGWGRLARFYREFRSEGGRFHREDPARISEAPWMRVLLSAMDLRDKRVLDVGCGFGYYALLAAEMGAQVTAIDFAREMVELAGRQAALRRLPVDVRLGEVGDLSAFPDHSFDVVVSGMDLETPDLGLAFREVARVLVARGPFLFSVPHPILHHGVWQQGPDGSKLFFQLDRYFERGPFLAEWCDEKGQPVRFWRYRRPLQDYTEALSSNGFVIRRLLEAEPSGEGGAQDAALYEELHRVPWYLIIQAEKEC